MREAIENNSVPLLWVESQTKQTTMNGQDRDKARRFSLEEGPKVVSLYTLLLIISRDSFSSAIPS